MARKDRYTHTGGRYLDRIIPHDLLSLLDHLPLLFGVVVFLKHVDLGDDIESYLMRECLRVGRVALQGISGLLSQFLRRALSRARCCLIGGNHHAFDVRSIV